MVSNSHAQGTPVRKVDKTYNRPNEHPLPTLLEPLHRILRVLRAANHLTDAVLHRVLAGAGRVRRDVVEDVAQLVSGRRRGGDFQLELAAFRCDGLGFGGCGGLFEDVEDAGR